MYFKELIFILQVYVKAVDSSFGVNTDLYGQPDEVYTIFSGYLVHAV
jgi:hypothetical protein